MRNLARQLYRQKNNEAARKSRESAKQKRAQRRWVLHHPDLTTAQREDAEQFLQSNGKGRPRRRSHACYRAATPDCR